MAVVCAPSNLRRPASRAWPAALLGLAGILLALALPFAPVWAETTTLTWPAPGQQTRSASAIVVPYRPADLTAFIPCSALRAAGPSVVVLATGTQGDGLVVTGRELHADDRTVALPAFGAGDCGLTIAAGADGLSVSTADGWRADLPDQPVPQVFGFRTDLPPPDAAGLTMTVRVTEPFTTSPGTWKIVLIAAQLIAAVAAALLLRRASPRTRRAWRPPRWRRVWWIDVGVIGVLAGWAVIGPLAVDDGWATMIARNFADTGNPGNYYRWWNAAEVPFALGQQLLSPLTAVSIAPLWLRLPSTVVAIATWFVVSRGVLGAALPTIATTPRVRLLAALSLLVAWLPFNLGTRPEAYVALGVTTVLALAMRSRQLTGLCAMVAVAALTVPISPNGLLVLAPIAVFAPRLAAVLKSSAPTRAHLCAHVLLLCCVGAVGLTVIFADQSWDALVTATDWHTFFGPSLPWYDEAVRYQYLLQNDQQGSVGKRLPVLMSVAAVVIVAAVTARRGRRPALERTAARLAIVVAVALLLFALAPSKWSYHLGAAAGLFAALMTVGVVLLVSRARAPNRRLVLVGVAGAVLVALAAALAFDGPNAWWLPAVYDVPWADSAPKPWGVPLNNPLLWLALIAVPIAVLALRDRRRARSALIAGPAVLTVAASCAVLALLLGSFVAAPLRRPAGSLALANLNRLDGGPGCGLVDDVQLLPDGTVLAVAPEPGGTLDGFVAQRGFPATAPPPDAPGVGTSTFVWGSHENGPQATAQMTSPWFVLPPQPANGGVAIGVSGRTGEGNVLGFEFGRADGSTVTMLGAVRPADRPASDEDPAHPLWRSIGVDATDIPVGADRVRLRAVDGRTDEFGWLAFTGPRQRTVVPLGEFLADNGPVLISWPMAFLFPCVRDIPTVAAGVASTPRTLIESPRPPHLDDRDRSIGGTFHELDVFGDLYEIPSRLSGAPEVDWGSVLVSGDTAEVDAYQRTTQRELVPGVTGTPHREPER